MNRPCLCIYSRITILQSVGTAPPPPFEKTDMPQIRVCDFHQWKSFLLKVMLTIGSDSTQFCMSIIICMHVVIDGDDDHTTIAEFYDCSECSFLL